MWGATPLDQLWCRIAFRKLNYQGRFTPPSLQDSLIFPGNNGIMNWGSVAVDQARGIMVVPTSYMPLKLRLIHAIRHRLQRGLSLKGGVRSLRCWGHPMRYGPSGLSCRRWACLAMPRRGGG